MTVDASKFLTANGWADDRLMQAYDLIWEVGQASKALGMDRDFTKALGQIEYVSTEMAQARADLAEEAAEENRRG